MFTPLPDLQLRDGICSNSLSGVLQKAFGNASVMRKNRNKRQEFTTCQPPQPSAPIRRGAALGEPAEIFSREVPQQHNGAHQHARTSPAV